MRVPLKLIRALFWALWTIFVVAALVLLAARYYVLPRIDEWRPQIERYASEALGAHVLIGRIEADWKGLNPRLTLDAVAINDVTDAPVLSLPKVQAVLAWRSLLQRSPRLVSLRADGLELTLRRDASNHLWVAGQSIDLSDSGDDDVRRHPALRWLGQQQEIALTHASVRWLDEARNAPELLFTDVSFVTLNGALSHRFAVRAKPPQALAQSLEVRGEVERSLFRSSGADRTHWHGQLYADVSDAAPADWSRWIDLPPLSGRMAARAWLQLDGRHLGAVTMDVAARGTGWKLADGAAVHADALSARIQGLPGDLLAAADLQSVSAPAGAVVGGAAALGKAVPGDPAPAATMPDPPAAAPVQPAAAPLEPFPLARSPNAAGIAAQGKASGVSLDLPGVFQDPKLSLQQMQADIQVRRGDDGVLALDLRTLRAVNTDLDLDLRGAWRDAGKTEAGTADVTGTLRRGSMNAIHRYLPLSVTADARDWLASALQAGVVDNAGIVIKGDLDDFPYTQPGAAGRFHIGGKFAGATVDYAPAQRNRKGWPAIVGADGSFAIDGAALTVETLPGGVLKPLEGRAAPLALRGVKASIPDMEKNSELYLQGEVAGPVAAYLSLAAHSPLGAMLDNTLDEARGTGDWNLALALKVPLLRPDDANVDGTLVFNGNEFALYPHVPPLTQVRGMLEFSEKDVRARDVQAQFLGGPVKINGGLLDTRSGLRFEGSASSAGLSQLVRGKVMERFSGRAAYRGRMLYRKGGQIDVMLESDLAGMAVNMPAPAGKDAASALPLKAQWSPAQGAGGRNRTWLSVTLGKDLNLLLEHDSAERRWYFPRGTLYTGAPPHPLPAQGFAVRLDLPELDLDAWGKIDDEFVAEPAAQKNTRAPAQGVLAPLNRVALNTPRMLVSGITFNDMKLLAERPAFDQWQVKLQSRQADGSISWREASGRNPGQVTARFKYLAFGGEASDAAETRDRDTSTAEDLQDIPAVDLQADNLRLYGKDLGTLQVVGANLERGQRWRLDKLRIANPDGSLDATGSWRLSGAGRGLTVDANAKWADFGKLLTRLGLPDTAAGGTGTASGQLTWHDLPWSHDPAKLDGKLAFSLDKGRFIHVNSRTARVLELLSLQSVQRLAKLDLNPSNLFRDGFPFDTIRGHLSVRDGVIYTDDYKIKGPVADISLAGKSSIVDETWDLKAVVVPNLDASGAAVATAFINPLIGLGALLTQWVLKHPLARAMTTQYAVTGSWNDPKVAPIEVPSADAKPGSSPFSGTIEN